MFNGLIKISRLSTVAYHQWVLKKNLKKKTITSGPHAAWGITFEPKRAPCIKGADIAHAQAADKRKL